jgi:hydroxymethylglutaryl-CoA reductase (NADPH)
MNLRSAESVEKRRKQVESLLQISLSSLGTYPQDLQEASKKHCENMIGYVHVPVGVAGPLLIADDGKACEYYLPLATTEGALIASVNRGCKAIYQSSGVISDADYAGQTRGPVFSVKSIKEGKQLCAWIEQHIDDLKKVAAKTSSHLALKNIFQKYLGTYVFVRFSFDTMDAMGMNMATIATGAIAEFIQDQTGTECISIAANFDVDKKPSWLSVIENRGYCARAQVFLSEKIVGSVLKTTPKRFFDTWLAKCMVGSSVSGSMGQNAQYANIVAAMFIAAGQDPAHVVEGSIGITTADLLPSGDLAVSVYLPCVLVGTVGGGTTLSSQKECLGILGLEGIQAQTFARIIAGACLAGELSLISSLAQGSLERAHRVLGRGEVL